MNKKNKRDGKNMINKRKNTVKKEIKGKQGVIFTVLEEKISFW